MQHSESRASETVFVAARRRRWWRLLLAIVTVLIGAPALMASIARLRTHGMTLVIADDARTIRSPAVKEIQ